MVTLEDGGTIDLSGLNNAGSDDQAISLNTTTNIVTLEDGGTFDLTPYLDNTDDQAIMSEIFMNKCRCSSCKQYI